MKTTTTHNTYYQGCGRAVSSLGSAPGVSLSSSIYSLDLFGCAEDSSVVEDSSVFVFPPVVDILAASGVTGGNGIAGEVVGGDERVGV